MASDTAKKYFDRGLAFFHRNEHDKAAELFKKAVFEDPDYPEALYNLASCQAVLGEEEDAFIYLDRASKLNPQCLTWAKEDSEYDNLREDERFTKIFEKNDILNKPSLSGAVEEFYDDGFEDSGELFGPQQSMEMEAISEGMPKLDAPGGGTEIAAPPKSDLPNCANCGGILEEESVPRYPVFMSMGLIFLGTVISIILFSVLAILIGLPIIIFGFYMFLQNDDVWVCLACGSRGKQTGQPIPAKKKKAVAKPQKAR